jgi:hypothetical protein
VSLREVYSTSSTYFQGKSGDKGERGLPDKLSQKKKEL